MNNHTCKVCDSTNIEFEEMIVERQRFKCLDCGILFFDDGEKPEKAKIIAHVDTPEKIYSCKYCDFKTPVKGIIIGHYASKHSWWHRKKEGEVEEPMAVEQSPAPIMRRTYKQLEQKLGDFFMFVTEEDLAELDDEEFGQIWRLLGKIIRNRFIEEKN